jgi:uncharacterized membrane protein
MVIHFPSALLVMDLVFSALAITMNNDELSRVSYYCLIAGVAGGWLAILSGLLALFTSLPRSGNPIKQGMLHAGLQFTMITGFTVVLSLEYKDATLVSSLPASMLIGKSILIIALLFGNYLGRELLVKYILGKKEDLS